MSSFNLTIKDLKHAMELRGSEAHEEYKRLGGAKGIAKSLKTDTEKGINNSQKDIEDRTNEFGANFIPPKKPKTFFELALAAVEDLTLQILIGCAVLSLLLAFFNFFTHGKESASLQCKPVPVIETPVVSSLTNLTNSPSGDDSTDSGAEAGWLIKYAEFIEGAMICAAIMLVILVTAGNDYAKEQQFRGLQDKLSSEQKASVIRGGEAMEISVADLVVGDICRVKYGDLLPADGFLVHSNDLKIDESSLTGESDHVVKGVDVDPALLGGTHIMEGSGSMIITAVGVNSQSGIIFMLLGAGDEDEQEKPAGK